MTKGKPKIAVFATVTEFGGAETVVLSLIKHINRDVFDLVPVIFTVDTLCENELFNFLYNSKTKYHRICVNTYRCKYLNPLANVIGAYKFFKRNKFDLIHTHGYRADIIGIIISTLFSIPVVATCHGFIFNDRKLTLYNRLDIFALRYARKIFAVSRALEKQLVENGIKESHIILAQNAVDGGGRGESFVRNRLHKRQICNLAEKDFIVGYIGRLSEEKGVRYLVQSITMLNVSGIPAKLIIIGQGPQRGQLEDLVKNDKIETSVIFAGFQTDIKNWLPIMDVFVLPSLSEGTPMALLEAMAFGIPSVASAVGGVPDVILSGENGILVSPGKPQEITDAITYLYKNEDRREQFAAASRETIQLKYNVGDWTKKIEAEYLKILQKSEHCISD